MVEKLLPRGSAADAGVCNVMADILNRIGDKWSVMVVGQLSGRRLRFNELRHAIGGISQRMLTLTLRNLERDGLVTRTVYPEIPPRVEYELTELGATLRVPLNSLWDWAAQYQDRVKIARIRYDRDKARASEPATRPYAGAAR
jgi:DNA-binding HxlR family transcriptional regulator